VDKKKLLRAIHEDPSLAFHVVESLSQRVRELSRELAELCGRARPEPSRGAGMNDGPIRCRRPER
jgi:hypothetical protein